MQSVQRPNEMKHYNLMNSDAAASTKMPLPPRRPAVTLTFALQNLIRSSVGAKEYSL